MKILTCNTHSLVEKNYEKKLDYFIDFVYNNDYDIIAMQEVNQSIDSKIIDKDIKEDNHILRVVKNLEKMGKKYYYAWTPIKIGYDKYDEGIGIISKYEIKDVKTFYVTEDISYNNWRTRKIIGIKIEKNGKDIWFFSCHFGWYKDNDSFSMQFLKCQKEIKKIINKDDLVFLMGDFNNPADVRNEGYDEVIKTYYDTFDLAKIKDSGITVSGLIDGWKDYKNIKDMRIDFIFVNQKIEIKESRVVCNGKNGEIVSDHYFVEIEF